jgi:mono/diheme cytochrome c family protein
MVPPMLSKKPACLLVALFGVVVAPLLAEDDSKRQITYEADIRPIFKAYCFHCHGEEKELAGGLDVRMRKLLAQGGESGDVLTPGEPDDSLLLYYVTEGDMPPEDDQRLSSEQVDLIRRWIASGAPTARPEPDETPAPGEFFITEEERSHWAFRPIVKPEIPAVDGDQAGDNPIDAFIARKLHENGLSFSEEADRITLIRRASFDLLGIPPTPEEVAEFINDDSPNAYEKLIDRLLESPHYGERWGRHWLDVAGYADSEGYVDDDPVRPDAWLYRDYVIRSLNHDKPWDQFLIEQIAGDELVNATHANAQGKANADEDAREKLTATGFLRMAPDGTGAKPMDVDLARNETITETLNIVSSSLLGMTIGCAECHDHRFDPIPQSDFYELRAVFAPVFDHTNWRTPQSRRAALLSPEDKQTAEELEEQAKELQAEHDRIKEETVQLVFERILEDVPEEDREAVVEAFQTPTNKRTDEQKEFLEENYPMVSRLVAGRLHLYLSRYKDGNELKEKYETFLEQANELRAKKPAPDFIRVATEDTKNIPTTHVFYRGDLNSPEEESVPPGGGLSVLTDLVEMTFPENDESLPTTGRRLAFARSLVGGKHPLVPRVLVNRFWMHHFGQALVDSPGDFGLRANAPSHPELLDWLAADFVENGWHLKRFHKLVMTSRTYRQSSTRNADAEQVDADNRLLWRMPVRRLESEAVRDAILAVSGSLQQDPYGPPVPVTVDDGGLVTVNADATGWKRSLYVQYRRTQPVYLLEAFDNPNMEPNCERRVSSTVATQSLTMLNDRFIVEQADTLAERIFQETGDEASLTDRIRRAWQLAFNRDPNETELEMLTEYTEQQLEDFRKREIKNPDQTALASLCQVIFGTNEFLYVE